MNPRVQNTADPSTVVVALSGGGDSALAAALLQEQGWNVTGLHFILPATPSKSKARTLSVQRVGGHLRIPIFFMDLMEVFTRAVMEPFTEAYLAGLTPNPCVVCNERIKFEHLARFADENGIDYLSTGHYARVRKMTGGCAELWRGKDTRKEQSYFLHRLNRSHLSRTILPLGNMTKQEARFLSKKMGLPTSSEPESQEICFLPGNDYRLYLEDVKGESLRMKGDIVTQDGKKVGEHSGTYRYTIGQRHGLGISSPAPYYVIEIRPRINQVVVARKAELYASRVKVEDFHRIDGEPLQGCLQALAQVRYRHIAAPGRLDIISANETRFEFEEPQWAITPGQALVCYDGNRVIGGGWIRA